MTNAAIRIGTLFDKVLQRRSAEKIGAALARHLHTEPDTIDYYLAVSGLARQLDELEAGIDARVKNDRARAVYHRAIGNIRPYLSPAKIVAQSTDKLGHLANDVDQLFVIGELFPDETPVGTDEKISEMVRQLEALQASVGELDIDSQLSEHLTALLGLLIMALRSHKLLGPEGVARAFGSVASEMWRTANSVAVGGTEPPVASWFGKTIKTLKQIGAVVVWTGAVAGAGSAAIGFGHDVTAMLTLGDDAEEPDSALEKPNDKNDESADHKA